MPPGVVHAVFPPTMPLTSESGDGRLQHQYASTQGLDSVLSQELSTDAGSEQGLQSRTASISTMNRDNTPETNRSLPARTVTAERFDEAYAEFILYCNPTIPSDTDTTELKQIFRAPPKSDGKNFNIFTLFELIRKLELKEIKTWAQLALDLGVEPPALDKGQSAQKVQQYAVSLKVSDGCTSFPVMNTHTIYHFLSSSSSIHPPKSASAKLPQRWMHAMHVDAFFEYLLNKTHVYWTQISSADDLASGSMRDGVAPEEDLALRALLPETRPKRGRRKAEDRDDSDLGKSPSQRPRLASPTLSDDFMITRSGLLPDTTPPTAHPAHPDFQSFNDKIPPWSATEPMPATFKWPPAGSMHTSFSAYPQSAITPRTQLWNDAEEPRSAITPKSRSRRRHGSAVSSAWPSNGNSSSGKIRGRPPSNRSVTDGPFSTFPANPASRDIPSMNLQETPTATPVAGKSDMPHFFPSSVSANPPNTQQMTGRPSRLQLQVPQRQGGNVRLATPPPPPVVLVNGKDNTSMELDPSQNTNNGIMEYFNSPGDHYLTFGNYVSFAFHQNEDTDRTNMDALESHFLCEILAAEWFDSTGAETERCSIGQADKICKQVIKNLQAESSSTEAFLINLSALAGGPLMTRLKMTKFERGSTVDYDCCWKMRFGSTEGTFTIRATVDHGVEQVALAPEGENSEATWKQKYLELQQQIRERDKTVGRLKRGVLDALVVSNQYTHIT